MRERLIDGLIQGDRLAWLSIAALWIVATSVVLLHRPGHEGGRRSAWTWLLFTVATVTSLAGLPLSTAIAVPRVRWKTVEAPDLVAPSGESWRRLRGPAVAVAGPDVAVPTLDATDRWILVGVLSGKPVAGLPAAQPAPMQPGAPRLCLPSGEACRPWPVAWPDPARPIPLGELDWAHPGTDGPIRVSDALAYDVERGLYLRRIDPTPGTSAVKTGDTSMTPGGPQLELAGRIAGDAPRDGEAVLFVARKVAEGRLKAVRIVAFPTPAGLAHEGGNAPRATAHAFRVQRAEMSLTAGPRVLTWVVRPLLVLTSFALPLGVLALLLAPLLRRAPRRVASAWIAPYLEAAAVLSASTAAAAPAVVAIASLWGSR